jgi:activator of 2-hydroxyglutaryl-CoA dehydratase
VAVTGTAGMGVAERGRLLFVQELVACADFVTSRYPEVGTLIDLGGEDAKIVFFGPHVDMRMNGNCAGGTGAFIDQMSMLLDTDPAGLEALAGR